MAADGLVEKLANPTDARFVLLQLSEKGKSKALQIHAFEEKLYEDLETLYSEEELAMVGAALEKMLSHFPIAETLRNRKLIQD